MQTRGTFVGTMVVLALAAGCSSAPTGPGAGPTTVSSHIRGNSYVARGESESATSVPSCSWPIRTKGHTTPSQTGLVRCYLRALAADSLAQLAPLSITHSDAPTTLTRTDLRHADDARHGTTVADFMLNDSDPFDATVVLTFSDGQHQQLGMDALNPVEPASRSWRLDIGKTPSSNMPSVTGP